MRLYEAIAQFLAWCEKNLAKRTTGSYRGSLGDFLGSFPKSWRFRCELNEVRPPAIDRFISQCRDKGNVTNTIIAKVKAVSSLYAWAIDAELCEKSPVKRHHRLRWQPTREPHVIDECDYRFLIAAGLYEATTLLRLRARAIIVLGWFCGLRKGEILDVTVKAAAEALETGFLRVQGKGGKVRHQPMPERAKPVIRRALEIAKELGSPWLMASMTGGQLGPQRFHAIFKRVAKRAGMPELRPHDLRHSFCHRAIEAGVELLTVQRLMGHADPATTLLYLRKRDEKKAKKKAVDKMFGGEDLEKESGT